MVGAPAANMVDEILHMKKRMDALYRRCLEAARRGPDPDEGEGKARPWEPAVDVYEDERTWIAVVDLPGVSEKDLLVEAAEGDILIRGTRTPREPVGMKAVLRERSCGPFQRRLAMPGEAVQDGVSAEFRDGVLTIRVPKKEADSRKIMVRSDS